MSMLVTLACSALVVAMALMLAFPRTPTARVLHRQLVERPASFLLDFSWTKLGRLLLVALALPLLAVAGPEMLAMFAVLGGDATAIELMIAVFAMSMSGGLAAAWRLVRTTPARLLRIARRLPFARSRVSRRRTRRQRPPEDDSSGPEWAFA